MTVSSHTAQSSKAINISLWVVQVLLGALFAAVGFYKFTTPIPDLAHAFVWPGEVPEPLVRFIGASELLGGIGLVLPALSGILPRLTPLAGVCLVVVMCLAAGFHIERGEYAMLPMNAVLAALAGFVAWGRFVASPIEARWG